MMTRNEEKSHQIFGIRIGYTTKKLTPYGGFVLIAKYFEKIELRSALKGMMPFEYTSPNRIKPEDKLIGFMAVLLAGASRFSHMMHLGNADVLRDMFGLERVSLVGSTITRFFNKITHMGQTNELAEKCWNYLKTLINWQELESDWLSFDSTVITRYGEQEGAKKGYNPSKKGRASHHPLLAFLNKSRIVLTLWNRSGDVSSASHINSFFEGAYARIKGLIRVEGVLADSGFYLDSFINLLEAKTLKYVITAKLYSTLQRKIYAVKNWAQIEPGLLISEFRFKQDKWKNKRRYIVVRQSINKRKKTLGRQLKLFEFETESYRYGVWVTNMVEPPLTVWRTIRCRSNDENTIKELKEDLALSGFALTAFYPTEAAMLIRCFLYNLLLIFKTQFLPKNEQTSRISTLRFTYFIIPAHLGRNAHFDCLRLSVFSAKVRSKIQFVLDAIDSFSKPPAQLHCV
jgi:hypothetical protein